MKTVHHNAIRMLVSANSLAIMAGTAYEDDYTIKARSFYKAAALLVIGAKYLHPGGINQHRELKYLKAAFTIGRTG